MKFSSPLPGEVLKYLYRAVRGDSGGGRNSLTLGLISAVNALVSRAGVAPNTEESSEGGVCSRARLGTRSSGSWSSSSGVDGRSRVSGVVTPLRFVGTVDWRFSIGESTFLK